MDSETRRIVGHATDRREFVRRAGMMALAAPFAGRLRLRAGEVLRIGADRAAAATESAEAHSAGLQLGIEEAQRAAALFGGDIRLVRIAPNDIRRGAITAFIGGTDADATAELAQVAERNSVILLNAGCAADVLRSAGCRPLLFHIVPSEAMCRDALVLANARAGAAVTAWDASLERFGADTLNTRFHERFGKPMTADAWCAWFAVKVLWESFLRVHATDALAIARHLRRDTTQFDGHKGRPLSFRAWDGQLRQPVYVVADKPGPTRVLAEVPSAPGEGESSRASLDRIGAHDTASGCRAT